jgi:hypothetical protein
MASYPRMGFPTVPSETARPLLRAHTDRRELVAHRALARPYRAGNCRHGIITAWREVSCFGAANPVSLIPVLGSDGS